MLRLVPALGVVLVLLAGCGGDVSASNDYVDRLNRVNERFARTAGQLRHAVTATSSARQDQRTLAGYAAAVEEVTAQLRRIQPPERVAQLHERYVGVMDDYADVVTGVVADLRAASSPGQALAAGRRLREASAEVDVAVNRAIASINARLEE